MLRYKILKTVLTNRSLSSVQSYITDNVAIVKGEGFTNLSNDETIVRYPNDWDIVIKTLLVLEN